jgi:hypothetical protein
MTVSENLDSEVDDTEGLPGVGLLVPRRLLAARFGGGGSDEAVVRLCSVETEIISDCKQSFSKLHDDPNSCST